LFDPAIFEERFRTIERLFAWEQFRRLLLRFGRLSQFTTARADLTGDACFSFPVRRAVILLVRCIAKPHS